MPQDRAVDPLERLLEAAYACVARWGMAKTTVEDVAREAGVSRATVYRRFPGGKDELLACVIEWEVLRFFNRMADAVQGSTTLVEVVERALVFAHHALEEHLVLQQVLRSEPQLLVPRINAATNRLQPFVRQFVEPYVHAEAAAGRLRPGVDPREAADYVARMALSYVNAHGRWDLGDEAQVAELVALVLGGVVAAAPGGRSATKG